MSSFSSSTVEPSVAEIKPYLMFNGNTREALNFYKDCLGGELQVMTFEGTPMQADMKAEDVSLVMHGTLEINSKCRIMASDSLDKSIIFGDNIAMSMDFATEDQITAAYEKLTDGGKVIMPLADQFWGGKFGQFADKFGVLWMLHMETPPKDKKEGDESSAKKQKVEEVTGNEGISLMPYIRFNSTCREVMADFRGVIGGQYEAMGFKGSPIDSGMTAEEMEKLVMHSTLKVNNGKCTVMASDCGSHSAAITVGTNVALSVLFTEEPPIKLAYDELSSSGKVIKALDTMFWGAQFAHVVDKHGLQWLFVGPHPSCPEGQGECK